jgi:hypothetical protein
MVDDLSCEPLGQETRLHAILSASCLKALRTSSFFYSRRCKNRSVPIRCERSGGFEGVEVGDPADVFGPLCAAP